MRIDKDLNLNEAVKKFTIEMLKDLSDGDIYLSQKDKVKELADVLLLFDDSGFYCNVDIKDGFEFIANNALDIQDVYQDLADIEDIEINPFRDLDKCIYNIFHYSIEKVLQESEYLDEYDKGEICLTEDVVKLILEEIENKNEAVYERG